MGLGSLKKKLEKAAMGKIAGIVLKKAAEGDFGAAVKGAYWFLAGKKTIIGALFVGAFAVAASLDAETCAWCAQAQDYLKWTAGIFVGAGLLDGALRLEPPKKA